MSRKKSERGIQEPRLPGNLPELTLIQGCLEPEEIYSGGFLSHRALPDQQAGHVTLECVSLTRVDLLRSFLGKARVDDVRFDACDISETDWETAHLNRVQFTGCRMMGLKMIESRLQDIAVTHCNARFSVFVAAHCRSVLFDGCDLSECSFNAADLSGVIFKNCDLSNADMTDAKLLGTDFSGSRIDSLRVGAPEMRGAIIDATQAVKFVELLGIIVK